MVVHDLACHVISLNAGCLWVTPSAIPGLHIMYYKVSYNEFLVIYFWHFLEASKVLYKKSVTDHLDVLVGLLNY